MARSRQPIPELPKSLAKLVEKAWPDGLVEEFDIWESYFSGIHKGISADLRKIRPALTFWQTPDPFRQSGGDWDGDDDFGGAQPDFQSYHVFFLSPGGEEFVSEDETQGYAEPDSEESFEPEEATYRGERTEGYAVGISLVARVAAISWSSMASFEDGSFEYPDIHPPEAGDPDEGAREEPYSKAALKQMEQLRNRIVTVLAKHKLKLLDEAELGLRAPRLRASKEVFAGTPVRVFDAFFFRGA